MWYYNRCLVHYGVLGMRWGIRRTPEQLGRNITPKQKPKSKHRLKLEEKYISKGISREDAEKKAAKRAKIEKVIAITGAITVAAATAYVVKKGLDINKVLQNERAIQENMKDIFDTAKNNGITDLADLPRISGSHDMLTDLEAINRRYGAATHSKSVWKTNCGYCATAFELRRRGFDVEAVSNGKGVTPLTPASFFNGVKWKSTSPQSAYNNVLNESKTWGEGARGMVQVVWSGEEPRGHVFSFELKGGRPVFLDPQTNDSSVARYFSSAKKVIYTRTDNLELKDNVLNAVKLRRE